MANWNALMSAPNAGQSFMQAFQGGRQQRMQEDAFRQQQQQQQEDRQFQLEDRERKARAEQLSEAREKLTLMGRLMEGATPEDYGQRVQAAAQMGLDVSNVPPQFDPQWLTQSQMQVRALLGQVEQELMAVAPGTRVIDKRTGKEVYHNPRPPRYIPVQAGGRLVLDPSSVEGGLPPMAGGDDDEWEIIGGPGDNAGGNFPR